MPQSSQLKDAGVWLCLRAAQLARSCGLHRLLLWDGIEAVLARLQMQAGTGLAGKAACKAGVSTPALVILAARIEDERRVQHGHLHTSPDSRDVRASAEPSAWLTAHRTIADKMMDADEHAE